MKDLVKKKSVEAIVDHRDRALELYKQAEELIQQANLHAKEACVTEKYGFSLPQHIVRNLSYSTISDTFMEDVQKYLDQNVWSSLVDLTKITDYMDHKTREEFRKQMSDSPPEVTVDNVMATITGFAENQQVMFYKGLVNIFDLVKMYTEYKNNQGFGFNKKMILKNLFSSLYGASHRIDVLHDLDKICHILDGLEPPDKYATEDSIYNKLHKVSTWNLQRQEIDTKYFTIKVFANGNAHVYFKEGVREKLNNELSTALKNGLVSDPA